MKKILIVHNKYLNLGGEDLVVLNETKLLSKKYEVRNLYFQNSSRLEIYDFISFLFGINFKSLKIIKNIINEFNPDIVYFHNLWFKINIKTVLKSCKNIPYIFIKQHNLRHECIQGMHYRKENLCHLCQTNNRLQGIKNKCYHQSIFRSIFMTLFSQRYLKLLRNEKVKVLTFSRFHIDRLITNKVKKENISVLNNFIERDSLNNLNFNHPEDFICFVGRASREKGVHLIIKAYENSNFNNIKLLIIGNIYQDINPSDYSDNENIIFKNQLPNDEVQYLMKKAKAIILGSVAYEGHPVTLSEALISNTLLIYPSFSGLDELMPKNYDFSYEHNNVKDLVKKLNLLSDIEICSKNKLLIKNFKAENYKEEVFFSQFDNLLKKV